MTPLTLATIAATCQGRLEGGEPQTTVTGVSTDTRTLAPGQLFVALPGEVHNGHDFVPAALERGAAAVMVARPLEVACPRIVVADTLLAYGRLGARARQEAAATYCLATTGSAGKTTTKDMLGSILQLVAPTLVARGTENNEVGVPRLLLELDAGHRFCVVELAMRGPGEIAYLAGLSKPQVGVITNVGEAHVGRLGSREAIAKAKAELLTALPPDGVAVLNADDFFFGLHKEMAPCRVVSFGFGAPPPEVAFHVAGEDLKVRGTDPARFTLRLGTSRVPVTLQLAGRHNVANALAAAAAASAVGADLHAITAGLERCTGSQMRSQVIRSPRGFVVIDDSYNASPTSTPEALKVLGQCAGRRVFVFGDMLELGASAERAHREIGALCAELGVDWLITCGPAAALAAEAAEAAGLQVNCVAEPAEAVALLRDVLGSGDTVLVKASRAMALERVVEGLLEDA